MVLVRGSNRFCCSGGGNSFGAILGRFVAGATAGAVTGASLDGVLFDQYECRDCEHTFD